MKIDERSLPARDPVETGVRFEVGTVQGWDPEEAILQVRILNDCKAANGAVQAPKHGQLHEEWDHCTKWIDLQIHIQ
eukprot:Skav232655  [mRNA]  locus=scaffold698:38854:39084:- [translate_table: standard]